MKSSNWNLWNREFRMCDRSGLESYLMNQNRNANKTSSLRWCLLSRVLDCKQYLCKVFESISNDCPWHDHSTRIWNQFDEVLLTSSLALPVIRTTRCQNTFRWCRIKMPLYWRTSLFKFCTESSESSESYIRVQKTGSASDLNTFFVYHRHETSHRCASQLYCSGSCGHQSLFERGFRN